MRKQTAFPRPQPKAICGPMRDRLGAKKHQVLTRLNECFRTLAPGQPDRVEQGTGSEWEQVVPDLEDFQNKQGMNIHGGPFEFGASQCCQCARVFHREGGRAMQDTISHHFLCDGHICLCRSIAWGSRRPLRQPLPEIQPGARRCAYRLCWMSPPEGQPDQPVCDVHLGQVKENAELEEICREFLDGQGIELDAANATLGAPSAEELRSRGESGPEGQAPGVVPTAPPTGETEPEGQAPGDRFGHRMPEVLVPDSRAGRLLSHTEVAGNPQDAVTIAEMIATFHPITIFRAGWFPEKLWLPMQFLESPWNAARRTLARKREELSIRKVFRRAQEDWNDEKRNNLDDIFAGDEDFIPAGDRPTHEVSRLDREKAMDFLEGIVVLTPAERAIVPYMLRHPERFCVEGDTILDHNNAFGDMGLLFMRYRGTWGQKARMAYNEAGHMDFNPWSVLVTLTVESQCLRPLK
ncbi:MAG: hypothetical protein QGG40_19395, partial [Myxococcota bacterium]|nr:hypothetical protein [Myxococcota bacterium]